MEFGVLCPKRKEFSRCGRFELNFECFSPEMFALMSERQAWPLSNSMDYVD